MDNEVKTQENQSDNNKYIKKTKLVLGENINREVTYACGVCIMHKPVWLGKRNYLQTQMNPKIWLSSNYTNKN
jgi:hypothetical protein